MPSDNKAATDSARFEELLWQQPGFFQMLFMVSLDGLAVKNTDSVYQVANPAFGNLLNYSVEEIIGITDFDLVQPADAEFAQEMDRRVFSTGKQVTYDKDYAYLDGTKRLLQITKSPLYDASGALIGVLSHVRDIFEQLQRSSVMNASFTGQPLIPTTTTEPYEVTFATLFDLEEIQHLQDSFAQATGVASIITDPAGRPLTKASNFCRLCQDVIRKIPLGLKNCMYSDAIIGRPDSTGPTIQPCLSGGLWDSGASISVGNHHIANWLIGQVRNEQQDEDSMMAYARQIGADEEEFRDALQDVTVMSREKFEQISNTLFLLANQLSSLAYRNVQQTRAIAARERAEAELQVYQARLEDIVMQRTAELVEANTHLAALTKIKDEFVSNVSHELQTPITNMVLRQYLLHRKPEQLGVHLGVMERETQRLKQIIDSLLELSRLDQGQVKLSYSQVDLNDLVLQYVADRLLLAQEQSLTLTHQLVENLPFVLADRSLLEQVLSILLTNAMNYTPDGGTVTVETQARLVGKHQWVGFSVQDTGPGILPDEQERLFERFYRGTANQQAPIPGTGLGLALAREIITRHDGTIDVYSTGVPGEGARFTIWLPM